MTESASIRILPIERVMEKLGVGRTMVYKLVNEADFPGPIKIGRSSRWVEHEVDAWLESRIVHRNAA